MNSFGLRGEIYSSQRMDRTVHSLEVSPADRRLLATFLAVYSTLLASGCHPISTLSPHRLITATLMTRPTVDNQGFPSLLGRFPSNIARVHIRYPVLNYHIGMDNVRALIRQ